MLEDNLEMEGEAILKESSCCFSIKRRYFIPTVSEDPRNSYGILKEWLKAWHKENREHLPRNFEKRDFRQLLGMFNGMYDNPKYGITMDKLLRMVPEQYSS